MQTLRIDLVSDIACPWCAIGYRRLERAMAELDGELAFELEWQPFELNPDMPPEGEPILEHLCRKYGRGEAEMQAAQEQIMAIAQGLGLDFRRAKERRAHNTFDAHRVLAWAKEQGQATAFSLALFDAYFGAARNPSDPELLRRIAESLGLDGTAVDAVLASDRYADTVREEERRFMEAGITAVPAFVIDRRYLVSGAQEPAVLADTLRRAARELAA